MDFKGNTPVPGSSIVLNEKSAAELAKFLKELYLDEDKD